MNITEEIVFAGLTIGAMSNVKDSAIVGSAAYSNNPNDLDIAILTDRPVFLWETENCPIGEWQRCGDYDTSGTNTWTSVRRDNLNLMITNSQEFFDGYKMATEVCIALKLENKADRIKVCQIVRDKKKASEV